MSFAKEADMYDAVIKYLPKHLAICDTYAVAKEFPIGYRVIDLIFLPIVGNIENFDLTPLSSMNSTDIWSLAVLMSILPTRNSPSWRKNTRRILLRSARPYLNNLISKFGKVNFEQLVQDIQSLQRIGIASPVLIELKLRDWRSLVDQTIFCRNNANIVCAVMDSDYGAKVALEPFSSEEIGFFLLSNNHIEEKVALPHKNMIWSSDIHFNYLRAIQSFITSSSKKWEIIEFL